MLSVLLSSSTPTAVVQLVLLTAKTVRMQFPAFNVNLDTPTSTILVFRVPLKTWPVPVSTDHLASVLLVVQCVLLILSARTAFQVFR